MQAGRCISSSIEKLFVVSRGEVFFETSKKLDMLHNLLVAVYLHARVFIARLFVIAAELKKNLGHLMP